MLDDYLRGRGVRDSVKIQLVIPFGVPIPPSPETSEALVAAFAERGIEFIPGNTVTGLDPATKEAILSDGRRLLFDLFLGIPVHRASSVVEDSGLAEDGWIPVDKGTLATRFPDVYAIGDVTSVGTAKAGVFSEGQAKVVADRLAARIQGDPTPPGYDGTAACYIEFGSQGLIIEVASERVDAGKPKCDAAQAISPRTLRRIMRFIEARQAPLVEVLHAA